MSLYSVDKLMAETRRLAAEYRRATGKPLAVGGEIAKYDAVRLLGLTAVEDDTLGYDALGTATRDGRRIQIKGRAIFDESKGGHRVGQLRQGSAWDLLLLVLMDENFETFAIYEAEREAVDAALDESASSKRARRGALSVARLKVIGRLAWSREGGIEPEDGIWEHPGWS